MQSAPSLELFAHGLADVVRTVGLATDPRPVAAGHANRQIGGDDPRPVDDARDLGVAQRGIGARPAAEGPHRGEARLECLARMDRRAPATQRVRLLHLGQPVRTTAHREVDVAIDQTGQQRGVRCVDAYRALASARLRRRHLDDAVVFDAYPGVVHQRIAFGGSEDVPSVDH